MSASQVGGVIGIAHTGGLTVGARLPPCNCTIDFRSNTHDELPLMFSVDVRNYLGDSRTHAQRDCEAEIMIALDSTMAQVQNSHPTAVPATPFPKDKDCPARLPSR